MPATQNTLDALLLRHKEDGEPIRGLALNSFLLMVSRGKKSHTFTIESGQKNGILHLKDGTLIDAEYGDSTGLEAAYKILAWKDVSITMGKTEQRPQQIANMLSRNLIKETKETDEVQPESNQSKECAAPPLAIPNLTYTIAAAKTDPTYQKPLQILSEISTIQTFFLLNMAGKVAVHSAKNAELGELIIYTIVTCSRLKKSVDAKALKQIQMDDLTTLLILPVAGIIIGLLLQADTTTDEVVHEIKAALHQ